MSATPGEIRVLHVDDEAFVDRAATMLEREDGRFEVETATSVDDGVERLADGEFDCVVSGYDLPDRTGVEFLRGVRDTHPDLPFVLFTGEGSERVASDAISAGATDYLRKGSGTEQYERLADRIADAVSRARNRRAERHLRELAEATDRVLSVFSADWDELLFVNDQYEEVWGRSVESLRADPTDFLAGVHPDDRDQVRAAMERLSAGEAVEGDCRVVAGGTERWVRLRGEPITDESGAVVRVAGFATDVTGRRERERTLREQTERLQEAQRVAGVGSWEWDAASDTVEWSDETYRIFGWDPEESTDPTLEDWLDAVHPEDLEKARKVVAEAMETGSFATFEHRIQRHDGDVRWVRCRGNVTQEDGRPVRITGTILDITERTEHERG